MRLQNVADFLGTMAEIAVSQVLEEERHQQKLKEFPKGYHFDKEGYSCVICGSAAHGEQSWYDNNGLKCMLCQHAINTKIIPGTIAKDKDSYYIDTQLKINFNLDKKILTSWIKEGIVKDRVIPRKCKKGKHLQIFLLKDNKGFFPPHKKINIGGPVKETKADGQEEYVFYPWYYFVDPVKNLKNYRIVHVFADGER